MDRNCRHGGFSLIELVLVMVILAVVSAIAMPRMGASSENAQLLATQTNIRTIQMAALGFHAETGAWPSDVSPGVMPSELKDRLPGNMFALAPPIGEHYDWNYGYGPGTASVAVFSRAPDHTLWRAVDARFDDGDLSTGTITGVGKSLFFHLAE